MKKIVSLLLALTLMCGAAFALTSCGDDSVYIGVQSGTTGYYYVKGDADWDFPGINGYTAKGYDNGGLAVNDMKNGAVKYAMIDEQPAKLLAKKIPGVKVIDIALTEEEYAFGVDKAQSQLLSDVNRILGEMKTNGKLDEIITAYATGEGIKPFASATFDAAKADKQLVVATNASFAPFEYMEGNKYAGIDMEIAKYIADELDMELVIKNMAFEAVVTSVGANGIDIAMAGLTVNETRKASVNFSESYYEAAQMLVVLQGDTAFDACQTADDVLAVLASELAKVKK